jgi:hypothetical protein
MAKAEIESGQCGFAAVVLASMTGKVCSISITSDCEAIQKLASELTEVDPYREISFNGEAPLTFDMAAKHCPHAACPVPIGIIKAVEIEAGMAVPADVRIKLSKAPVLRQAP